MRQGANLMKDALYVVLTLGFFAASVVLVYGLERLRGGSGR
jgi:hypothetical protein